MGCANTDEVAQLGDISSRAQTALPVVSADFYHSCRRQAALQGRLTANAAPTVPPDCKPFQVLSAHLAEVQSVLADYMDALAKLASDQGYGYSRSAGAAETAIAGLSPAAGANAALAADAQKAGTAAVTLSSALTGVVLRHAREREMRRLVLGSNDAVQALTQALGTVVAEDYKTVLDNEQGNLKLYYEAPLALPKADPLVAILVQRQYDNDTAALERRREAAADYGAVMKAIGTLHAKLTEAAREPAAFRQKVTALAPDLLALRNAVIQLQTEES